MSAKIPDGIEAALNPNGYSPCKHILQDPPSTSPRARMSWAQLLTRVFAIDITTCPQCSGPLTILAAIEDPAVIGKILSHLGLPTRAPPRAPARIDAFLQTA